jgi:hypothetical protein
MRTFKNLFCPGKSKNIHGPSSHSIGSFTFLHTGLMSCHQFCHSPVKRTTSLMSGLPVLALCTHAPISLGRSLAECPLVCN